MNRGGPRPAPRIALQANNRGQIGPLLPHRGEVLVEVVSLTVLAEDAAMQPLRLEIRIPGSQSPPRRGPSKLQEDGSEEGSAGSVLLQVLDARTDMLLVTLLDAPGLSTARDRETLTADRYGAYLNFGPEDERSDSLMEPSGNPQSSLGCLRCPLAGLLSGSGQCLEWTVDGLCTVRLRILFFPEEREETSQSGNGLGVRGRSSKGSKTPAGNPSQAASALRASSGFSRLGGDAESLWSDSPSPVHPPRPPSSMH